MMKSTDFVAKAKEIAAKYKTLYVMGCFGAPMNAVNKKRYTNNNAYNKQPARTKMINAATADTFGFDCVCLLKGILWGWNGDVNAIYGGAKYGSNGVPDVSTEGMINLCSGVSTNFSNIEPGEMLWLQGHAGIYIGNGLAVECTPAWKNKVQVTAVGNIGAKAGYNSRRWTKHGKLPWVTYNNKPEPVDDNPYGVLPILKVGSKGDLVTLLQIQLKITADGDFGTVTETAVKTYQKAKKLEVDGIVGKNTYKSLFG